MSKCYGLFRIKKQFQAVQPLFHSKGDGKGPFYLFISKK